MVVIDCPRCHTNDIREQSLPANHDRGEVRVSVCNLCGEQIGPVLVAGTDLAISASPHDTRPAGKLPRDPGSSVLRPAPLAGGT